MFQVGEFNELRNLNADSGLLVVQDRPTTEQDEAFGEDEFAERLDVDRPAFGGALELQAGHRRRGERDDQDSHSDFDDDEDENSDEDDEFYDDDLEEDDEDGDDDFGDVVEDDED